MACAGKRVWTFWKPFFFGSRAFVETWSQEPKTDDNEGKFNQKVLLKVLPLSENILAWATQAF